MKKIKLFYVLPILAISFFAAQHCAAEAAPIAAYDFDELKINAATFTDQSGNNLNGRINGATVVGGISGAALYFNGSSYASVANDDKFNFGTGDFAISAWVKTVTTATGEVEGRRDIVGKGDPYNSGYMLSSMNNRASALVGRSGRSGYGGYCGTVPINPLDYNNFICPNDKLINDGLWHNLATVRQDGTVKIYLDKVLVHQYQNSDNVNTPDDLIIGRHGEKRESFFRGKIDKIKIYNSALNQGQINSAYDAVSAAYNSNSETESDRNFGFDSAKEFNPNNDGNFWYVVKPEDTPWNISQKLCGHGEWWKSVIDPVYFQDANHNTDLPIGSRIKLSTSLCSSSVSSITLSSIDLSAVDGNNIKWKPSGYAAHGYKVVWSMNENPVFPPRNGDQYHFFSNSGVISDFLIPFAGNGTYYVRVCENNLLDDTCGVYSNQIKVELKNANDQGVKKLEEIRNNAGSLYENKIDALLAQINELKNTIKEQEVKINYLTKLQEGLSQDISSATEDAVSNFIAYGVDKNSKNLGEGERAAVMYSFKAAFDKLPETQSELEDAIKIANGRWPSVTSDEAEAKAKEQFKKIYLRDADMNNAHDTAAVKVMAYGLRQQAQNRNLNSEAAALKTFKAIFKKVPQTTEEWNTLQAITYSGASR